MTMTYLEAIVVGALQGVSELFPISSLGHSVLLPALIGGRWATDLSVSAPESPYLAFVVGLHVATAVALLLFFWRDWVHIIGGFFTSIRYRRVRTPAERLAWLIILATIPVGISGVLLEHLFRTVLGRPIPAASFLIANGVVLFLGERLRRRAAAKQPATVPAGVDGPGAASAPGSAAGGGGALANADLSVDDRLAQLPMAQGVLIGSAQILALLAGISRSGVTMVAGLLRGLSHEDAARFSFLLATPAIFGAGVLKLPDLFGHLGAQIHGQALVGAIASFITAYFAVRFLTKYFQTRTLTPFAIYCVVVGAGSLIWLTATS
jgi:undecaprenyl-diphosphatase